ncbi:putative copper resistance protein D [Murinocardiopsis flavida]|uniref:Putative copper resistance protein D n=1 Tax=Murinocardiopsis flavida TaxID=645275 RepID=A0A2P8DGQ3_9ACTN|nr:cytochrome c oxidase assembly protein [Murinocardiopsis flavida]PSK96410.1 putative copper resistance protein D [Murinocardiopsis flavida]
MASPGTRESDTGHDHRPSGAGSAVQLAVGGVAVLLIALLAALLAGGSLTEAVPENLSDPGDATRWGLPIAKAANDVLGAVTVGLLLMAALLLPAGKGLLGDQAQGYVRAASWAALGWGAAAALTLVLQLSDILGMPPLTVLGNELTSYAGGIAQGRSLMLVILIATGVALAGRSVGSSTGALGMLGLALAGLVPPALTGHAASSPNHELAVTGVALHVLAISVWVGGIAAVGYHALRPAGTAMPEVADRFSRIALWAYIGVAVSGAASSLSRLYAVHQLWTEPYGRLILAKIALFAALGAVGYLHRTRTVPRVAEGAGRRLFARIAAVEVLIMSAVMGLAVALSRTDPPDPPETPGGEVDPVRELLGFAMPPPPTFGGYLTLWRPDLFFIIAIAVLGGLYAAAVVRLVRRGDPWPWGRTVAWFLGLLTMVAVLLSGISTYAMVLFSTHMVQHMVLSMLTPILLVLGAPATLALRALKPARKRGDRGPREWLNLFLQSRFASLVTHPAVAAPLFVVSTYALYFTPLFGTLMSAHLGHLVMNTHFILTGFLFYWIVVGIDPAPRKIPFLLRIVLLLLVMGFHAFFGIAIMMQSAPIGMEYYGQFDVPWQSDVAATQYEGGGIAWAIGEIPTALVLLVLVRQWSRDEERTERRRIRHSRRDGSDDADMDDYNAYLKRLEEQAKRQG